MLKLLHAFSDTDSFRCRCAWYRARMPAPGSSGSQPQRSLCRHPCASRRCRRTSFIEQVAFGLSCGGAACRQSRVRLAGPSRQRQETEVVGLCGGSGSQARARLLEQHRFLHTRVGRMGVLLRDGRPDANVSRSESHRTQAQTLASQPGGPGGRCGLRRAFFSESAGPAAGDMWRVLLASMQNQTVSSAHCCELPMFGFATSKMPHLVSCLCSGFESL